MLAISPLLGEETVEIPVYLGDSANIPARVQVEGVDCYSCLDKDAAAAAGVYGPPPGSADHFHTVADHIIRQPGGRKILAQG